MQMWMRSKKPHRLIFWPWLLQSWRSQLKAKTEPGPLADYRCLSASNRTESGLCAAATRRQEDKLTFLLPINVCSGRSSVNDWFPQRRVEKRKSKTCKTWVSLSFEKHQHKNN